MRYLLALACVVCLAVPVFAQESTVRIDVPEQQRQGVFVSPSWTIPPESTIGMLTIRATMPQADFDNPDTRLVLRIYALDPVLGTWRKVAGGEWAGGRPPLDPNDPPALAEFAFNYASYRGLEVRGELEVPVRMRVGFSLISTP